LHGPLPVRIHSIFVTPRYEYLACFRDGRAHGFGYLDQRVDGPNVFALHKIGLKQRLVDAGAVGLCAGPGAEFLSQTAVVRVRALAVWQPLLGHKPTHARLHSGTVYVAAGEQRFQRDALLRRVRMQGEMRPDELQIIGGPKSLNTPRTEVAPGSNVIGENF